MGAAPIPTEQFYHMATKVGVVLMSAGSTDVKICKYLAGGYTPWIAETADYRLEIDNGSIYCRDALDAKVRVLEMNAVKYDDSTPIRLSEFLDQLQNHQLERAEHAMSHGAHRS